MTFVSMWCCLGHTCATFLDIHVFMLDKHVLTIMCQIWHTCVQVCVTFVIYVRLHVQTCVIHVTSMCDKRVTHVWLFCHTCVSEKLHIRVRQGRIVTHVLFQWHVCVRRCQTCASLYIYVRHTCVLLWHLCVTNPSHMYDFFVTHVCPKMYT